MAEPLKNAFDQSYVKRLADVAASTSRDFDAPGFVASVVAELPVLELKDRVNRIADELHLRLGNDYVDAIAHVVTIAERLASPASLDGAAWGSSMAAWPLCSIVERHGIAQPDVSLAAMVELTRAFSCEFAIRPFLHRHLETTLAACRHWVGHAHPAVRRLASEGTRPYLPWGTKVPALLDDPGIGISLIEKLRHDPDAIVRRSVANHLNDIARDHPDRAAHIAAEWLDENEIDPAMVRHALRGLVKKGHPGAMAALGFTTTAAIDVSRFSVEPNRIFLGDTIAIRADIASTAPHDQRLVVDFVIHHVGARGTTSPKVFKWKTIELPAGGSLTLEKRRLIQTASTRRYYAGNHRVELKVAGRVAAAATFELADSST